eukprot:14204789-Ditylum_brightwellii.AAC.1
MAHSPIRTDSATYCPSADIPNAVFSCRRKYDTYRMLAWSQKEVIDQYILYTCALKGKKLERSLKEV